MGRFSTLSTGTAHRAVASQSPTASTMKVVIIPINWTFFVYSQRIPILDWLLFVLIGIIRKDIDKVFAVCLQLCMGNEGRSLYLILHFANTANILDTANCYTIPHPVQCASTVLIYYLNTIYTICLRNLQIIPRSFLLQPHHSLTMKVYCFQFCLDCLASILISYLSFCSSTVLIHKTRFYTLCSKTSRLL